MVTKYNSGERKGLMEGVGARLKKIRLEKGLTLEEVRKRTKIHLNVLKAIEEDSLVGLNPVYIRGFLKIYCRCLDVDPQDYLASYRQPQEEPAVKPGVPVTPHNSFASFLKSATLKLNFFKVRAKKFKVIPGFILIAIVLIVVLFNLGKRTQRPPLQVKFPLQPSQVTIPAKKEIPRGEIMLGIRAKEDCWVHLKADGQNMFRSVLKKGRFETWKAKEKMELSLGNAGGVELELNGKPLSSLGRRGQVIKNILITKEQGLVVPR